MIPVYEENTRGRDFIIGDLHGHVSLLCEKMNRKGFNPFCDRLFSVGDLVDRGPESEGVLELLNQPWFHPVMGNHEQCAIDYACGRMESRYYVSIGGAWLMGKTFAEKMDYALAFQAMPLALEIEIGGGRRIGVVHADCPFDDWDTFRKSQEPDSERSILQQDAIRNMALWNRGRIEALRDGGVAGIHAVIVGHTPQREVTSLGNVFYVDTGCGHPWGKLTMKCLKKMFP